MAKEPKNEQQLEVGVGLFVRLVDPVELKEQDLNAQTMPLEYMERLTENVRQRGQLESLPYCYQPNGEGPVEIISGHHRVRAAVAAGIKQIPILVDTVEISKSKKIARQIAHNQLVGEPDPQILEQMVAMIESVDDLLATGLDAENLPMFEQGDALLLGLPHAEFDWRTVAFTFLPNQLEKFDELIDSIEGTTDLVGAVPIESFPAFAKAVSAYSRIKNIKSIGTTIAVLTRLAADRVALDEDSTADDEWVKLESILGTDSVPAAVAQVLREALEKAQATQELGERNAFQILEFLAADYLAGS